MNTIDESTTANTKTYFYDSRRDIFSAPEIKIGFFEPTHKIIVDSGLDAIGVDKIMAEALQ